MTRKSPNARRTARLTLAACAVALSLPAAAPADTVHPLDAGELLFGKPEGGQVEFIWPDGTHRANFGTHNGRVGNFHADGQRATVSYGSFVDDVSLTTFLDTPVGNGSGLSINDAAYSPDGTKLALATATGLWELDPSLGGTSQLANGYVNRVATSSESSSGKQVWNNGGIWLRQGNLTQNLVSDFKASYPSIAQTGSIVAWEQIVDGDGTWDRDIVYMDLDVLPLEVKTVPGMTQDDETAAAVSPDGKHVAYARRNLSGTQIHIAPIDGSTPPRLVPNSQVPEGIDTMAWRPSKVPNPGTVTITGDVKSGATLTAAGVGQSGHGPWDTKWTWERCPAELDGICTTLNETGSTYEVQAEDVGSRIRATRTLTNAVGPASAQDVTVPVPTPDSTPPVAPTLTTPLPDAHTKQTSATFTWTGEQGGRFECQLDSGPWTACTSGHPVGPLTSTLHRFRVKQFDAAGNEGPYAEHLWTVDTNPPSDPFFEAAPPAVTNSSTAFFFITAQYEDDTFQCRLDGADWEVCPKWDTTLENLADGEHTFEARQVDAAGNASNVASHTWKIDSTVPAAPVLTETPGTAAKQATATFAWTPAKDVEYQCRLDGARLDGGHKPTKAVETFSACESPVTVEGLADGKHVFEVRAVNPLGTRGAVTTHTWVVDTKPAPAAEPRPEVKPEPKPEPAPAPQAQTPAAPVVVPQTPAKPRALTAIIGRMNGGPDAKGGDTASSATIKVEKQAVGVGCQITGTVLTACKVDLYADVATGAQARAAAKRQVLVGTGTYEDRDGSGRMSVKVELNATGRAMLRRSPEGLKVNVRITGTPVSGEKLRATGVAKLVAPRASAVIGGFAVNSPKLTAEAKRTLRRLAARFDDGRVAQVRCVGHTDGSSDDVAFLDTLGARRAKAVCRYLAAHGVKAEAVTTVSRAATRPAATNRTAAGRAKNRRVELRITR